ncbi:MAG: hypothetical protein DRQ44_17205 [Gammaproteobacteria bacterium]|nr:MAG: hypothetical protein DRQ44_17205 [Gammaproteobacteria bacterium]
MKNPNLKLYKPYQKWFGVNLGDKNLTPVYISLPDPPDPKLVAGYGLHPDDQFFKRVEIPAKLKTLEERVITELQDANDRNSNARVTEWRIYKLFWEIIEDERDHYKDEIKFIKNVWWWRINGYFFYNDGEITFIPPDYFDFLNFWQTPDINEDTGDYFFEFRMKDRDKFLYKWYLERTTEAFRDYDKEGVAIKVKGKYHMVDMGNRTFYGSGEPKTRRSGATTTAIHKIWKITSTIKGAFCTMVSMDGDKAVEHWEKKMIPGWNSYPLWLKPMTSGGKTPTKIKLAAPSQVYGINEMKSVLTCTKSAGEKKNDGEKIHGMLSDEEGKGGADVYERWNVNALTMSLNNGLTIIGWSEHPSTVEQMEGGGLAYYKMMLQSNFYQRYMDKGQTISGLARIFFPNYLGIGGFVDRFGRSVVYTPTERQMRLSPKAAFAKKKKGLKEIMQSERDQLLRDGSAEAMEKHRSMRRKQPMEWEECWLGEAGEIGFDMNKIDKRLAEHRRLSIIHKEPYIRGNFVGDLLNPEWVTDPDGPFWLSVKLKPGMAAEKITIPIWDAIHGAVYDHYAPMLPTNFVGCGDVFGFDNKDIAKQRNSKSRLSDGGISIFMGRNMATDEADDISKWTGHKFVLSYRHRTTLKDYCEDVARSHVYFGAMFYPERNKEILWQYFIEQGLGGYLLHDTDVVTGKLADKPGFFSLQKSKDELFSELKQYIDYRCHDESFPPFLQECKDIRGPEVMQLFDRLTAHGGALLGYKQLKIQQTAHQPQNLDLGSIAMFRPRSM